MAETEILIIGAGPTGLAAALFLADRGYKARIVERQAERSPWSKAFGVNARSLSLLEASGVTKDYLANGRKLERLNLHRRGRTLATLRLNEIKDRFPFLLVQSQSDSERLIEAPLAACGVTVERNVEVVAVANEGGCAKVTVRTGKSGETITRVSDAGQVCKQRHIMKPATAIRRIHASEQLSGSSF